MTTDTIYRIQPASQYSLFTSHDLSFHSFEPIPHQYYPSDWIFGLLFAGLLILAIITYVSSDRIRLMIQSPFSKRYLGQLTRDGNLFTDRITYAFVVLYVIMLALAIFQLNYMYLNWDLLSINGFFLFLLIAVVIILFWVIKIFIMDFLAMVFRTEQIHQTYLTNILLFNSLTGIILLPVLIFAIYLQSDIILFIAFMVIFLLFLVRFLKGFLIGISMNKFSYLFLFVYLCALELLPLLVLTKLIIRYN